MQDASLIIERNMLTSECERLMERVIRSNPRLRGAKPADVISMAHDSDAMVSITEDLWHTLTEVQYAAVPSREDMELYGQAMTAIALVYGPNALDYDPRMINGILTRYTRVR